MEQRVEKLENHFLKTYVDPKLDAELTEWFKSNPEYSPISQPEHNNGVVMPEHLSQAFSCRIENMFSKKKLEQSPRSLMNNWKEIYP